MLNIKEQIFKQIDRAKSVLVVFPADWQADTVAASLALFSSLKKIDKNVEIAASWGQKMLETSPQEAPRTSNHRFFSFLPGYENIKNEIEHLRRFIVSLDISHTKVSQIKYVVENNQLNFIVSPENGWFEAGDVTTRAGEFRFDLIIVVGADDLESLGAIYDNNVEFFYKTPIINISCRAASEEFGQINLLDLSCSTVSEIIFQLLKMRNEFLFDENIATNLLAGIILKTKNFKSGNLTPEILMTASELISLGARREEIINQLYKARRLSDLKMWGRILNNLKTKDSSGLAWSFLDMKGESGIDYDDDILKDLVSELMTNLPDTRLLLIIIEREENKRILSAFSLKNAHALDFLSKYQAHGNSVFAWAETNQSYENIVSSLIGEDS